MKDKVVILARVSTNKQDYDRQVIELTEYCNRVGWEVAEVFANKVSGAKAVEERAEIVDMIEYIIGVSHSANCGFKAGYSKFFNIHFILYPKSFAWK